MLIDLLVFLYTNVVRRVKVPVSVVSALTKHRQVPEERSMRVPNKEIFNDVSVSKYTREPGDGGGASASHKELGERTM